MNKENEVQNFPAVNLAHVRTRLLQDGGSGVAPPPAPPDQSSSYSSLTNSVDSNDNELQYDNLLHDAPPSSSSSRYLTSSSPEPNVLQVYAAYDTGLASGTSVRIQVPLSVCYLYNVIVGLLLLLCPGVGVDHRPGGCRSCH